MFARLLATPPVTAPDNVVFLSCSTPWALTVTFTFLAQLKGDRVSAPVAHRKPSWRAGPRHAPMFPGPTSGRLCARAVYSVAEGRMRYKRLGRTGLQVSEIGLGGHEYRRKIVVAVETGDFFDVVLGDNEIFGSG